MPGDFHRVLLSAFHRVGAKLVDEASFGAINALHLRHGGGPAFASRLRDYIARWEGAPLDAYYRIEGEGIQSARSRAALAALPPPSGERETRISFPSPLPSFPEADAYENDRAVYDLFPARDHGGWAKAPTLLMGHGLMSVSDIGYRRQAARLNALGWNAVFVHLPYHYARKPRRGRVSSGELAITADLVRTVEAVRQAVVETRLLLEWLSGHGAPLFAGWGASYGAWVMALLGCVEERMGRLILVEPVLDIQTAIWDSPACYGLRWHLRRQGVTREGTAPHMRLCCPLHVPPRLDPKHVLLLAGSYDKIAVPETIRAFHQKWEGSHFYEFPQGHVGYRLMPESFRLAGEIWGGELPPLA